VVARDQLARRATRSRTAVPWQGRPRRDLRRGKAEVNASPAEGRAVQGDNVQDNGVQDDSV
jgi:hypothetical protein